MPRPATEGSRPCRRSLDARHGRLRWPWHPDSYSPLIRVAFTVIELLIVIAIIIVLMGLLLVAMNAATRTAQRTNTAALMNSISTGLARFKDDMGYYPPVLGRSDKCLITYDVPTNKFRDLADIPKPNAAGVFNSADLQNWYSYTSLAEYLLGYAKQFEHNGSSTSPPVGGDGADGLGILNSGPDGVWGATAAGGCWFSREPPTKGKVYGPYLEIGDDHLLAAITGVDADDNPKLSFPGDGTYNPLAPKVICDYWGQPIRYYRQVYRPGFLSSQWRDPTGQKPPPDLGDVFVLRPWNFKPGEDVIGAPDGNTACMPAGDPFTTYGLKTAQFALFSSGVDKRLRQEVRRDDCAPDGKQFNADNLVLEGGS